MATVHRLHPSPAGPTLAEAIAGYLATLDHPETAGTRRAAELFEQATTGCPGGPWTLHQLRHSALTHAAEAGANTATLLAYSGHTSVTSLARYARVSPEALACWQARRDPARRR